MIFRPDIENTDMRLDTDTGGSDTGNPDMRVTDTDAPGTGVEAVKRRNIAVEYLINCDILGNYILMYIYVFMNILT
jgi:hypothetical protein